MSVISCHVRPQSATSLFLIAIYYSTVGSNCSFFTHSSVDGYLGVSSQSFTITNNATVNAVVPASMCTHAIGPCNRHSPWLSTLVAWEPQGRNWIFLFGVFCPYRAQARRGVHMMRSMDSSEQNHDCVTGLGELREQQQAHGAATEERGVMRPRGTGCPESQMRGPL